MINIENETIFPGVLDRVSRVHGPVNGPKRWFLKSNVILKNSFSIYNNPYNHFVLILVSQLFAIKKHLYRKAN